MVAITNFVTIHSTIIIISDLITSVARSRIVISYLVAIFSYKKTYLGDKYMGDFKKIVSRNL